jgi:hypothetical protein
MATARMMATERELTEPVDLCLPDGRLDPAAVGWSRRPLHRCNLGGPWGRRKRWDYWCVLWDTGALGLLHADFDYLGLAGAFFHDLRPRGAGRLEKSVAVPLALGFSQSETDGGGDLRFERLGLRLEALEEARGTRLRVAFGRGAGRVEADVLLHRPSGHETLGVVVPWSERRFQYTSKHNSRPAEGTVIAGGRRQSLGPHTSAFGAVDFGRGLWPYRTEWNWASASGTAGGRTIGLQLGGRWTDGTGATENALCVDGRLTKISESVRFEWDRGDWRRPWRIAAEGSSRVELRFVPEVLHRLRVPLLLASVRLHVCFGRFSGSVIPEDGRAVVVDGLHGWAEEMRARW